MSIINGVYRIVFLSLAVFSIATSARADIIRVDFEAEVTFTQDLPIFGISPSVGDLVTGFFTYDTNASDQNPGDPIQGIYESGTMGIEIGGLTITNNFTPVQAIADADAPNDLWTTLTGTGAGQPSILVDGVPVPDAQLLFSFTQPDGLLTSDAQPNLLDLALLEVSGLTLSQGMSNPLKVVDFDKLTSFRASVVPLPAGVWLFGTALAGLAGLNTRRKGV